MVKEVTAAADGVEDAEDDDMAMVALKLWLQTPFRYRQKLVWNRKYECTSRRVKKSLTLKTKIPIL